MLVVLMAEEVEKFKEKAQSFAKDYAQKQKNGLPKNSNIGKPNGTEVMLQLSTKNQGINPLATIPGLANVKTR